MLNISASSSFTDPLAIKSSSKPCSVKKMSISEINFPFLILLFNKLLKFDGLIIADSLFNWVISNSFKIKLIFLIFGSDFNSDKKSTYTFIFSAGINNSL